MAMGKLLIGVTVLLMGGALLAGQARADGEIDKAIEACHGKESTVEIVDCLSKLNDAWDKRLNEAYQAALKRADPAAVVPLRASERTWLEYRKQRCLYVYVNAGEGTIKQVLAADCFLRMLKARTDELSADAAGPGGSGG